MKRVKCWLISRRFTEYLDNELPEKARSEVTEHLEECTECNALLASMQAQLEIANNIAPFELPEGFSDKVMQRLASMETGHPARSGQTRHLGAGQGSRSLARTNHQMKKATTKSDTILALLRPCHGTKSSQRSQAPNPRPSATRLARSKFFAVLSLVRVAMKESSAAKDQMMTYAATAQGCSITP